MGLLTHVLKELHLVIRGAAFNSGERMRMSSKYRRIIYPFLNGLRREQLTVALFRLSQFFRALPAPPLTGEVKEEAIKAHRERVCPPDPSNVDPQLIYELRTFTEDLFRRLNKGK